VQLTVILPVLSTEARVSGLKLPKLTPDGLTVQLAADVPETINMLINSSSAYCRQTLLCTALRHRCPERRISILASYIYDLFQYAFFEFRTNAALYDHIDLFPEKLLKIHFHLYQLYKAGNISGSSDKSVL